MTAGAGKKKSVTLKPTPFRPRLKSYGRPLVERVRENARRTVRRKQWQREVQRELAEKEDR